MMPVAAPVTTNQPLLGHRLAELLGLLVGRRVARRAGRAEDRDLALRAIGGEDRERTAQLAERLAEDFQVVVGRAIGRQLVGRLAEAADQVGDLLARVEAGRRRHRRTELRLASLTEFIVHALRLRGLGRATRAVYVSAEK